MPRTTHKQPAKMMMMMIMIAGFVDSITTPIKSWLDAHHKSTTNGSMTVLKEKKKKKEESVGAPVECVVCLSEVCLGERFALLERCSHGFHVECVEEWLKDHPNCPLCRTPIPMAMYDYNQYQTHVYFKKSYEILSGHGFRLLEIMATWLTSSFNLGALQSSLSRSCSYL